jgi:uncharacterized membrane protein
LLTHTLFALHCAHMCYGPAPELPPDCESGLRLPGGGSPDDLDSANFAFTIGMTFQVSDVQVTSRSIRRAVLLHSILSFAYNTVIFAQVLT